MNEKIKLLWKQAGGGYDSGNQHTWPQYTIDNPEKFVELIVKECIDIANDTRYDGKVVANRIKFVFGLEETQGWVCPKCSADRTKIACPLGFGAQVDGRCPMTAEAQ